MKNSIIIIVISLLLSLSLTINITANNINSLTDSMIDSRETTKSDEVSLITHLLVNNGYGNIDTKNIAVENLLTVYMLDIQKLSNVNENDYSFKEIVTNEYFYRYYNTDTQCVTEVVKNLSGEWVIGPTSKEIKGYIKRFPNLSCIPNDITKNILDLYPTLDYNSVKFIYLEEVSQTLVYFTCEDEEYVAYYPLVEIDNGLNAGEIYTADEVLNVLSEYPIYNPITDNGDIGGGVGLVNHTKSYNWYVYPAIGISVVLIVGAVGYVIIKRKRA